MNINRIKTAVAKVGFAKLAYAVMHRDSEYAPANDSIHEAVKAFGCKLAAMRTRHSAIIEGISAYENL